MAPGGALMGGDGLRRSRMGAVRSPRVVGVGCHASWQRLAWGGGVPRSASPCPPGHGRGAPCAPVLEAAAGPAARCGGSSSHGAGAESPPRSGCERALGGDGPRPPAASLACAAMAAVALRPAAPARGAGGAPVGPGVPGAPRRDAPCVDGGPVPVPPRAVPGAASAGGEGAGDARCTPASCGGVGRLDQPPAPELLGGWMGLVPPVEEGGTADAEAVAACWLRGPCAGTAAPDAPLPSPQACCLAWLCALRAARQLSLGGLLHLAAVLQECLDAPPGVVRCASSDGCAAGGCASRCVGGWCPGGGGSAGGGP